MFSKNSVPSTSELSRNMFGHVNDSILPTYNQVLPNDWLNTRNEPSSLNYMQINMDTNYNCVISTSPITTPRLILCKLNIKEYNPEDLKVNIENGSIVIRGSHTEKRDEYSLVSRKFTRKLNIPRDVVEDEIKVHFISSGILTITAKKSPKIRELPIHRINETDFEQQRYENQLRKNAEEHGPVINKSPCLQLKQFSHPHRHLWWSL